MQEADPRRRGWDARGGPKEARVGCKAALYAHLAGNGAPPPAECSCHLSQSGAHTLWIVGESCGKPAALQLRQRQLPQGHHSPRQHH